MTGTGATVNGSVDPNGSATDYAFQYGTTTDYGQQTAAASAGSGATPSAVTTAISGLAPGTTYHYRAVALRNNTVVAAGADFTFVTQGVAPAAPSVTTTAATDVTQTGATLTGLVDANGTQTEFRFEYGPDTNYGTLTTPASGGAASGPVSRGTPSRG